MSHIHDDRVKELELIATDIRKDIIDMLLEAGSGHSAGPLGMADVFTALYFQVMHHKADDPSWDGRDRLFLSCGHICPVQYVTMAHAGYFPKDELKTLRKFGTRLQGHPERTRLPGIETTSGPLGGGLAQAVGAAYAHAMDGKKNWMYCILSDGEHEEGLHWEAVMFAGKYQLENVIAIVDRNNIQIDGMTEDIMPLESLREKYEAFRWHVLEIDGNDIRAVVEATNHAKAIHQQPTVIIANTIPGRGVDFMENDYTWHGKPPKADEAKDALAQLRTLDGKITSEHE